MEHAVMVSKSSLFSGSAANLSSLCRNKKTGEASCSRLRLSLLFLDLGQSVFLQARVTGVSIALCPSLVLATCGPSVRCRRHQLVNR